MDLGSVHHDAKSHGIGRITMNAADAKPFEVIYDSKRNDIVVCITFALRPFNREVEQLTKKAEELQRSLHTTGLS